MHFVVPIVVWLRFDRRGYPTTAPNMGRDDVATHFKVFHESGFINSRADLVDVHALAKIDHCEEVMYIANEYIGPVGERVIWLFLRLFVGIACSGSGFICIDARARQWI